MLDARGSAGRHARRAHRADDCRHGDRAHRVREPGEPAAVPGIGPARRVRRALVARCHSRAAGAADCDRSALPVGHRRRAWTGDSVADRHAGRAARSRRIAGSHVSMLDWRLLRFAGVLSIATGCSSASAPRCSPRVRRRRRRCSSTRAARRRIGTRDSATASWFCRSPRRWCCWSRPV